jgi:hypothetical protein
MATWHEDTIRVPPAPSPRRSPSSEELRDFYRERDRESLRARLKNDARYESSPNARTEHKNTSSERRIAGEWSLEDQIAELQLELRADARSGSRSGGWQDHHPYCHHSLSRDAWDEEDLIQLTIAQHKLREAEEKLERERREEEIERREELIRRKLEIKYIKARAEREAEEKEQRLRREWELKRETEERARENRIRQEKNEGRTRSRHDEANGSLRENREEAETTRRHTQSLDGESSDESPEKNTRVHHVSIYNTVTKNGDAYDHMPLAERHSRRADVIKEEAVQIEQPPDDIVNISFDRLMLHKGWYELPDDAQDAMMAYPASKKWDIISRNRFDGVERRDPNRDSRSVRFGKVPEIIGSHVRGTSSRAGGPLPRGVRGDKFGGDIERVAYVCTHGHCCTTTPNVLIAG